VPAPAEESVEAALAPGITGDELADLDAGWD
jgi:hypothetical protein